MRVVIPRVPGRGAGLGNELLPWAKAFLAGSELNLPYFHPAFGLNSRRYYNDFGTSRFDWVWHRALRRVLPVVDFGEADYLTTGQIDFGDAIRTFAEGGGIPSGPFVLQVGGMWGGFLAIERARQFVLGQLANARGALNSAYRWRRRLPAGALSVAIHVRLGDFAKVLASNEYQGAFNVSLPEDWYIAVCKAIRQEFGSRVQFMLFSDGAPKQLARLVRSIAPMCADGPSNVCGDLLAMAEADVLVCSVSSFSMWAAFLSRRPYLWFRPNLQSVDGLLSLWGHESSQMDPASSPTIRHAKFVRDAQQAERGTAARGVPVGIDGKLPHTFLQLVEQLYSIGRSETDLVRYGCVPETLVAKYRPAPGRPYHDV